MRSESRQKEKNKSFMNDVNRKLFSDDENKNLYTVLVGTFLIISGIKNKTSQRKS